MKFVLENFELSLPAGSTGTLELKIPEFHFQDDCGRRVKKNRAVGVIRVQAVRIPGTVKAYFGVRGRQRDVSVTLNNWRRGHLRFDCTMRSKHIRGSKAVILVSDFFVFCCLLLTIECTGKCPKPKSLPSKN